MITYSFKDVFALVDNYLLRLIYIEGYASTDSVTITIDRI